MNHAGAGESVLHCKGGGCTVVATGAGTSQIIDCTSGCSIDCRPTAGRCINGKDEDDD